MRSALVAAITVAPLLLIGAGLWVMFRWEVAAIAVGALWWFDADEPGATR